MNEILEMEGGRITGPEPGYTVAVEVKDNAVPYFVVTGRTPPTPAPIWCVIVSRPCMVIRL